MATREELDHYISLQAKAVQNELTVVEQHQLPGPLMHLSTNHKIPKFIPNMSNRTATKEDRTVARVCVAPTLLGCLLGYVKGWEDFAWPKAKQKQLLQNWTVYGFDTPLALKPSAKILYDQVKTDEHWLVGYSKDTLDYKPTVLATAFYKEATLVGRKNAYPGRIITLMVHVHDTPLAFSKNIILTKGYWEIKGPEPMVWCKKWDDDETFKAKQVTADAYKYVDYKEALASLEEYKPVFMQW